MDVLSRQWERQRQQLRPRVSEAEAKYDAILKQAAGGSGSSAPRDYAGSGLMLAVAAGLLFIRARIDR